MKGKVLRTGCQREDLMSNLGASSKEGTSVDEKTTQPHTMSSYGTWSDVG